VGRSSVTLLVPRNARAPIIGLWRLVPTTTIRKSPQSRGLGLASIDAVVASLRARGAELVGEVERYGDSYRLCYVRGPEGVIAEQFG
jgi:hypothetical protein